VFFTLANMRAAVNMEAVNIGINMDGVNLKAQKKRTAGQKHGGLREALLQEGLALLDTEGVDGVTIRAVARNAGVAHSAPANHFPSRQAMLTAIGAIIFADLAEQTTKAIADIKDDSPRAIQAFADACFQFAFDTPNRYQLLWQRQLVDHNSPVVAKEIERIYSALLESLKQDQVKRRIDIETDAIAVWSMIHGYISMRMDGNLVPAEDNITNLPRHKAILLSLINGIYYRDK
jgi:AcrR family transcriptional regulator